MGQTLSPANSRVDELQLLRNKSAFTCVLHFQWPSSENSA